MYTTQNYTTAVGFTTNQQPLAIGSDSIGLNLDGLSEHLQKSPVYLNSILDGITLVRGLALKPGENVDCHYALLLKGGAVVDLVCLNVEGETDSLFDGEYLPANKLNTRYLMSYLAETKATSVLLFSTRYTSANTFSSDELAFIQTLCGTLRLSNVNLLDWVTITPDENTSWRWQCSTNGLAYSGVSAEQLADHGTEYALSILTPKANA